MSLFVFNNQQKLIKSIPNRDLISVVQDQAINVSDTLFVEMPADIWSNLKEPASYLAVQDPYERFSYHMYKISKHTTKADTVDVEAIQIGYDELKAYGYIKDRRFNNRPVLDAATAIVDGTDWQIGYVDTDLPNVNTNFYYISRLEALSKLIEATGAEVRFRVEISGNKIIAKRLDLYKQLGTFKGKRFAYGSNLLEIVKEEDTSELYTALVGRGKGEETATGGFGRRITFADIAWSKASGKPVDKPLGQEFIELPEMTAYYGYPDGEPRTGIVEFGDIEEPEQLLKATYERLVEISRPQVQFKAKVQTTGDMQLGEEVAIIRSDLGFRYKTRVFRVKRDYLNNMFTEVELGDKLTETLASRIKKIDITNAQREEIIIQYIQTAANGKNKIFRSEVEPTEGMMVNDLWYKPIGDGEMEMYQWNGTHWELILSTLDTTKIQQEVEAALSEAESAKQAAEQAYLDSVAEAERLVTEQNEAFDAKFETETGAIRNEVERGYTDAITNAQNYIDAETTIIDNKILEIEQEVSGVKTTADKTVADINTAVTNAGFTSLGATISHVKSLGEQANSNAQVAVTNAEQSLQIASELAGNAEAMLNDIIDTRGLVNGTYVENKVDDATGELSQKITKIETLVGENIRNLVVRKDEIKNQTLSTTGNHISTLGHSISTKLIPVGEGETLSFQNTEGGWRYAWLNQNKEFISMVIADDNTFTDTAPIHTHFLEVSYTTASSPMITRGSEQKDFVLAPEDNNTDEAFRILQAEYKSDVEGIQGTLTEIERSKVSQSAYDTFYQNEFSRTAQEARDSYTLIQNGVEGRLSATETEITRQAGLIASKVAQTEFDDVNSRLSAAETMSTQNKNAIDLRATKTEVKDALDNVYTYGRNLINGSKTFLANDGFKVNTHNYTHSVVTGIDPYGKNSRLLKITNTTIGGNYFRITNVIKGKGPFTFSAWMKRPAGNAERVEVGVGTDGVSKNIYVGDTWVRHDITGVAGDNFATFNFIDITFPVYANVEILIFEPTLVKGDVAQEWTPSFLDTEKLAETTASSLTIESGKISSLTSRVSESETNITSINQTISGIDQTIATLRTDVNGKATITQYNTLKSTVDGTVATVGNHSGRITQVEQNVNGLQTTVASKADQSQITQLSNAITSTVKNAVDTLEANGRNYFHKGLIITNVLGNTNFVKFGDTTPQGFTVTGARDGRGYIRINNVITGNGLWTVTFDLGTPQLVAVGITVDVCDQGAKRFITRDDNKQERVSLTVNVTNHSSVYNFVDFGPMDWANFTINNIKIEKGGKSTPYVIAIEDTAPSSQITQLSNQINLRVAKGDVVSQLNIEAGRTLISSGKIYLDGDTYILGTTFVNDIKAKSLEAVNADVANLRTKILTADVITSTHLKVDNALVDKLTATVAVVDRFFSKTAVIDNLTAKTLTAITANITSIRSQMLVTNVISSDHIQGGTAMVGKLFSSTASINELTSKAAFISNIKAIDISADKITTGTLNAANLNIINLNASTIVGLNSSFIQSNWNSATGGNVQATGDGLTARNTSSTFYTRLTSGLIYFGDDLNTTVGSMGSMIREGSNTIRGVGIYVENNKEFGVAKRWSASGAYEYIMRSAINSRGLDIFAPLSVRATMNMHGNQIHNADRIYFGDTTEGIMRYPSDGTLVMYGSEGVRLGNGNATNYTTRVHVGSTTTTVHNNLTVNSDATFNAALNMGTNQITNVNSIIMQGGTTGLTRSSTNTAVVAGSAGVYLSFGTVSSWSQRLFVGDSVVRVFRNLDMNGYTITGQSDRRLKTDITPTSVDSLDMYRELNFVDYRWTDPNKPSGIHLGVIAQDTPHWSIYDAERDIWMIDSSKQMMYNSLGIKELTAVTDKHGTEIDTLKQEIADLKKEIKLLKSA